MSDVARACRQLCELLWGLGVDFPNFEIELGAGGATFTVTLPKIKMSEDVGLMQILNNQIHELAKGVQRDYPDAPLAIVVPLLEYDLPIAHSDWKSR